MSRDYLKRCLNVVLYAGPQPTNEFTVTTSGMIYRGYGTHPGWLRIFDNLDEVYEWARVNGFGFTLADDGVTPVFWHIVSPYNQMA